MSRGMQEASPNLIRTRNEIFPSDLQKEHIAYEQFSSSLQDPYWAAGLQNWKIIKLGCFKPLGLWQFVTAATGIYTLF